jgi:hypothetical protein
MLPVRKEMDLREKCIGMWRIGSLFMVQLYAFFEGVKGEFSMIHSKSVHLLYSCSQYGVPVQSSS